MGPLYAEILTCAVVRQTFLTRHVVTVVDVQVSREMIPPYIFRPGSYRPCSFRIDIAGQLQIHVVTQREIVSEIAQIQASTVVVAEGRHDDTGRVGVGEGEETERDGQG